MRYIQMNNLHRWSKSWNTLTIRYGQILINVSSSPIGPGPVWNTAVVPCRQAGNNTTGVLVDGKRINTHADGKEVATWEISCI